MQNTKQISYSTAVNALEKNRDIIQEWKNSNDPLLKSLALEVIAVARGEKHEE